MVSYLSWAANAVLFVAACFLTANTANVVFASMLAPPVGEVEVRSAPEPAVASTWQERKVILDRNLFKSSALERSVEPAEIEEEIEATNLPLVLLGTAAAEDPALAWAAVQDLDTRKTLVVTLGDDLKGKATVVRIERRRIVLEENGKNRELTFGEDDGKAAPRSKLARRPTPRSRARSPRREPNVRKLGENRFSMPRDEIEKALKDPSDILSQARFLPKYDGEEMVGFQINSIKQGSVLQEFGLQNGDLITEFNGIAINDPTESAALMREFGNSSEISLLVEGSDGESKVINVDLDE